MAFYLHAVLTDPAHGLTLDAIEAILRSSVASDPNRSDVVREEAAPPFFPPHLRFIWRETDSGAVGDWFALIFLESGEDIREQNHAHVAESRNRCPDPIAVCQSETRVRVLFHDDPDREYTNTMIELMTMLGNLPSAIVYDPHQNEFTD